MKFKKAQKELQTEEMKEAYKISAEDRRHRAMNERGKSAAYEKKFK